MTLGQHITTLRKAKKLSQGELGKKVGTSGDIIGRYERDEVKPSIEVIIKIADALRFQLITWLGKQILNSIAILLEGYRMFQHYLPMKKSRYLWLSMP